MPRSYTTIQGDMWDMIAYKLYGRESCMKELLEANEEYRETAIFPSGVTLNVPEVSVPSSSSLPPWKR